MKKIISLLLVICMIFVVAACGAKETPADNSKPPVVESSTPPTDESKTTDENSETPPAAESKAPVIDKDRGGNSITLPDKIEKVMAFGPSNSEILVALGEGSKIIAIDTYATNIDGLPADLPQFDMMTPDAEKIVSLAPDVIFITGMSKLMGEDDPYKSITDTGVCVIYISSSESILGVMEDIQFVADVMGQSEKGAEIVSNMEKEIEAIKKIGDTITEKKKVYFEISAAPYMYSFGTGVFLNEMLELIGAENVLADQQSWISVSDEVVLSTNPDVILTSVNYLDDPAGEIMSRAGWDAVTAVKDEAVYQISTESSNRPSQNITKALQEMAKAIYPDKY